MQTLSIQIPFQTFKIPFQSFKFLSLLAYQYVTRPFHAAVTPSRHKRKLPPPSNTSPPLFPSFHSIPAIATVFTAIQYSTCSPLCAIATTTNHFTRQSPQPLAELQRTSPAQWATHPLKNAHPRPRATLGRAVLPAIMASLLLRP